MASKKRNGVRNLDAFKCDMELRMPHRVASLLDFWATAHPYDPLGYNEITKAVNGYRHMPRTDTEEVASMREIVGRASKILQSQYRRALVRHPSLGARATVDSMDTLRHAAVKRVKTVERAIGALNTVDEIIDLKSIPDTAENRSLKHWYQRDARGIIKQLASPEFLAKMLPPAPPEEKK